MMRLRSFKPADFDALCKLDAACFAPGVAYEREELAAFITQPGARTWVVESDGEIAGFLVARAGRAGSLHIVTIDVKDAFRRQGLGRALMDAAEGWARERSLKTVLLEASEVNQPAQAFYLARGYRKLNRLDGYYADGTAAWRMAKALQD
jgi:[ribosomal protein S18]-alanine N-acetyltransferase